jgi:2-polyprenyl-3-methyl-5-hydroxy-6-metoxy-1,4-benzoquinol methylase
MRYVKEVFEPLTFEQAKHVVLTSDPTNPNKFHQETKQLVDVLEKESIITEDSTVLDFGCGMGRVSKELINRFNCNVVGVDISDRMKTFATLYVANPKKFKTLTQLDPNWFDVCISVLVLQHTEDPKKEIEKIFNSLKPNGILVLLNENKRLVPSDVDSEGYVVWNDDNFDVFAEVEKYSTKIKTMPYPPNIELSINFYKKHV